MLLTRIHRETDCTDEKCSFEGMCSEVWNFYAELPIEDRGGEERDGFDRQQQ